MSGWSRAFCFSQTNRLSDHARPFSAGFSSLRSDSFFAFCLLSVCSVSVFGRVQVSQEMNASLLCVRLSHLLVYLFVCPPLSLSLLRGVFVCVAKKKTDRAHLLPSYSTGKNWANQTSVEKQTPLQLQPKYPHRYPLDTSTHTPPKNSHISNHLSQAARDKDTIFFYSSWRATFLAFSSTWASPRGE